MSQTKPPDDPSSKPSKRKADSARASRQRQKDGADTKAERPSQRGKASGKGKAAGGAQQPRPRAPAGAPARGKPVPFSMEIVDRICERIACGEYLPAILKDEGMPHKVTFFHWCARDRKVQQAYDLARIMRAEAHGEEILEIADESNADIILVPPKEAGDEPTYKVDGEAVARSRERIRARQWLMAKANPQKYGEKLELSGTVEGGVRAMSDDELNAKFAEMISRFGFVPAPAGKKEGEE